MTSSEPARISAAVINWNNRYSIRPCLDSLFAQRGVALDVVVLDNGSTDGSLELIRESFPNLRIIENGRNLGFAPAHNIGYRETMGDWHLVLNSDVILEPDYLLRLVERGGSDPRIGAVAGKLVRFERRDGQEIIDTTGIEIFTSRRVWDRGTGEVDTGQFDRAEEVFGCCAAAAIYRRSMLKQVAADGEVFGEDFFAYYEDVDLAWRMAVAGWKSFYEPTTKGRHIRGGSARGSSVTRRLVFRNRYLLLARNEKLSSLRRDWRAVLTFELFQFIRVLRYPALLKSLPELFRAIGQGRRYRRQRNPLTSAQPIRRFFKPGSGVQGWLRTR